MTERHTKLRAIDRLVEYLKESETKSYEEATENEKEHHIFNDVKILEQVAFDYIYPFTKRVKIYPIESPRSGKAVPNQYEIKAPDGDYFQSYESIIAFKSEDGQIYLDDFYWNYSTTTSKYRNQFLNESTHETKAKIKDGTYKLENLN